MMNITVTYRHLEATDSIKKHIEDKLGKLNRYLIKPVEAHVILSVEKFRKQCEITLSASNFHATAISSSENLFETIDVSTDKLERQVKKHKEILTNHKHQPSTYEMASILNAL